MSFNARIPCFLTIIATSEIRIGTITDIAIQNPGITELELPPTTSITIGVNEIGAGAEEHKH